MEKRLCKFVLAAIVLLSACFESKAVPTLYGYQMGDENMRFGFVSFEADGFTNVTVLKATNMYYNHLSAGEYLDGKIYAYTVEPDDFGAMYPDSFAVYDAESFELLSESYKGDRRVVDMTYDYSTNTMYALAEDEYSTESIVKTSLCVVDIETGDLVRVGDTGELKAIDGYGREVDAVLVALASDMDGNIYAMSDYRQFCKLDKFTGKATQVGTTHDLAVTNKFQSMTFDVDGTLYWAQQHPDYGWFTTVNPQTGEPTRLGTLGANAQMTALYIKKDLDKAFPCKVENLVAAVSGADHRTVELTWELPETDFAGNPVNVTAVKVYRFGVSEPLTVLPGDATSFSDKSAADGMNTYLIAAESASASGVPATVDVFAGYDMLESVNDLNIRLDGNTVNVEWSAPTETVNGGYSDFDNITYNVYRRQGNESVAVSSGISATEFSETLTVPGAYVYEIEPLSGGIAGVKAATEEVRIVGVASVPYKTGFEDDGDGPLWTFINDHSNSSYGWSIDDGYEYQRLDGNFAQLKTGGSSDTGRDWLISPPIHFEAGQYTISYYADNSTSIDSHSWEVKLGTDASDVTTFTETIAKYENLKLNTDWSNVIEETFNVEEAGDYHLGFYGFTTSTYATLKLDNLEIVSTLSDAGSVPSDRIITFDGRNVFMVSNCGIGQWQVVNLQGQVVMAGDSAGAENATISLDSLYGGLYFVKVVLGDGRTMTSKVMCD